MKNKLPGFVITTNKDNRLNELRYPNPEWEIPDDISVRLTAPYKGIALVSSVDGRGNTDKSKPYKKFLCYSFSKDEDKSIITSYLAYTFNGPVAIHPWDKDDKEKAGLLRKIDMHHINITPDRTPEKVISKHRERINGKDLITNPSELKKMAEKTYFDMLWNIPRF